jgi:hypothetical protein
MLELVYELASGLFKMILSASPDVRPRRDFEDSLFFGHLPTRPRVRRRLVTELPCAACHEPGSHDTAIVCRQLAERDA